MNVDKAVIFLATWALVSVALLILSSIFETHIFFGYLNFAGTFFAVLWAFVFTLVAKIAPKFVSGLELKLKGDQYNIISVAMILTPLVWVIKKLAMFTGMGVSNNFFVLVIALVSSAVAYFGFKYSSRFLDKIQ